MIVRILGDGQYELADGASQALDRLDAELDRAIVSGDEAAFAAALAGLVEEVHNSSERLAADVIVPSDLTVPPAGSSLDEVRRLLAGEGFDVSFATEGDAPADGAAPSTDTASTATTATRGTTKEQ